MVKIKYIGDKDIIINLSDGSKIKMSQDNTTIVEPQDWDCFMYTGNFEIVNEDDNQNTEIEQKKEIRSKKNKKQREV